MALTSLALLIQRKRHSTKSSYTHHTQRWTTELSKSFLAGQQIWFHKYSSIFQVFIVLIIQTKGTKNVAFKMFQKRKAETPRPSLNFGTAVASFQLITSNREAFTQMYKPTSLMALCPEINY